MTPPHDFPAAQRVTVVQSGGLKPATVMRVFAADRPVPKGFTQADVRAILRAAADPRLKSMPTTPPTDTCCDRYLYRITVTYPDGETLTFSLVDGGPTTAAAERLLRLVV